MARAQLTSADVQSLTLARGPETSTEGCAEAGARASAPGRAALAARRRWVAATLSLCLGVGCAGRVVRQAEVVAPREASAKLQSGSWDGSRCEHEGRADREVSESVGVGALKSSIRRVYRVVGQGEQRRRVLICREVDTDLDGVKDLFRAYDDQGQAVEERADANYDGVIDTWVRYDKGRIFQVDVDDAWDGQPDERRYYTGGKLARIERDTNQDGNPDVWEIYVGGRLDRMGEDLNHDGRVDRWSRDAVHAEREALAEKPTPATENEATEGDEAIR